VNLLAVPFDLEVLLSLNQCLERLDENLDPEWFYILRRQPQPKKSPLELAALDDGTFQFAFTSLGRAGRIPLRFNGELQQNKLHSTHIIGTAKIPLLYFLVSIHLIIWTVIFLDAGFCIGVPLVFFTIGWFWQISNTCRNKETILLELLQIEGKKK